MSDTIATHPSDPVASRRHQRQERQARVGLLRNPNRLPKPPPRRATLMGKWLDLRSSRRPVPVAASGGSVATDEPLVEAVVPSVDDVVARDADGGVSAINITGLIQAVHGLGTTKPLRTPYGMGYRSDLEPDAPPKSVARPASVLSPLAWVDDDDAVPDTPTAGTTPVRRSGCRRPSMLRMVAIGCCGVAMAVVVLLLMPFAGPNP